jgi:hypothetical protein
MEYEILFKQKTLIKKIEDWKIRVRNDQSLMLELGCIKTDFRTESRKIKLILKDKIQRKKIKDILSQYLDDSQTKLESFLDSKLESPLNINLTATQLAISFLDLKTKGFFGKGIWNKDFAKWLAHCFRTKNIRKTTKDKMPYIRPSDRLVDFFNDKEKVKRKKAQSIFNKL